MKTQQGISGTSDTTYQLMVPHFYAMEHGQSGRFVVR